MAYFGDKGGGLGRDFLGVVPLILDTRRRIFSQLILVILSLQYELIIITAKEIIYSKF